MTCERMSKREDHLRHQIGLLLSSSGQSLSTGKLLNLSQKMKQWY